MKISIADQLRDVRGKYTMTNKNTEFYHVPEFCGQCGAPMHVKQYWKENGHDSQTGEVDSYEALVYCTRERWWSFGYHDKRAMIFTPKKFSHWKNKHGLSVLTLIRMGI